MNVEKEIKDVSLQTGKSNCRRSLLKKAVIGVPAVMALANKPAFGAVCTLSGFQSVNPSGVVRHQGGCGGISPGAWKENGYKVGNMDGCRTRWIDAGYFPNPRVSSSYDYNKSEQFPDDDPGTLFFTVFPGITPSVTIGVNNTLHDVLLMNPGSLEFHVISNLLNSLYFGWGNGDGKMLTADIIGIYEAYQDGSTTYISVGGTSVDLSTFDLQYFLEQLYH
jgi:hypothetical protein